MGILSSKKIQIVVDLYSKTFLELIENYNQFLKAKDDLDKFLSLLKDEEMLSKTWTNLSVDRNQLNLLFKDLNKLLKLSPLVGEFISLLIEKQFHIYLNELYKNILKQGELKFNIIKITTAQEISAEQKEKLLNYKDKYFSNSNNVEWYVDSNLINGFICEMGSKRIDSSLASNITRLKQELLKQVNK